MTKGSSSRAVAYVGVISNKKRYWGVGVDADIIKASIEALVVAVNKLDSVQRSQTCKDERLLDITNYIYANYKEVTLDDLAEKFFLSKPYLSKYIKEKSGMTFGDILTEHLKNCIISHRYSIETNLDPDSSLTKFRNVILKQIA